MRKKKILIGLVMAMMIAGTTGCGNHKSDRNSSEAVYLGNSASNKSASYAAAATEASADWECGLSDGEFEYSPESAYNGVSSEARSVETDDTTNTLSQIDTEKLVYRCDMQFDTEDYNSSINELKNLMNTELFSNMKTNGTMEAAKIPHLFITIMPPSVFLSRIIRLFLTV